MAHVSWRRGRASVSGFEPSRALRVGGTRSFVQWDGYGGPLRVAVAVDRNGETVGLVIAGHGETTAWMTRVVKSELLRSLIGNANDSGRVTGHEHLDSECLNSRIGITPSGIVGQLEEANQDAIPMRVVRFE